MDKVEYTNQYITKNNLKQIEWMLNRLVQNFLRIT